MCVIVPKLTENPFEQKFERLSKKPVLGFLGDWFPTNKKYQPMHPI